MIRLGLLAVLCVGAFAQDTTAVLDGLVTDPSGSVLVSAAVKAVNRANGYTRMQLTGATGTYHLILPAGEYDIHVAALNFSPYVQRAVSLNVSQSMRLDIQMQVAKERDTIAVTSEAPLVESGSNSIGNVVTGRELVDLPLNGRNFTQLGLLQPGVAPMTAGLALAGGSLRAGQAYAVNGQRPESNNYLLDGVDEREPRGRRLCAEDPGGRDPGVPDSHADCARGVRRHQRRHHHGGHAVGRQRSFTARSTSSSATTRWMRAISSRRAWSR